jgi:hypothetical protein
MRKISFVNVAIHSGPRIFEAEALSNSRHRKVPQSDGDIANVRVGDPNALINIAHDAQNNVVADIIDIGTVRTLANYSALSQSSINASQIRKQHALVRVLRGARDFVLHE